MGKIRILLSLHSKFGLKEPAGDRDVEIRGFKPFYCDFKCKCVNGMKILRVDTS